MEALAGGTSAELWLVPSGTVDYTITQSPLTAKGFAAADVGQKSARKRHADMSTLALPTDKTAKDMALASKRREELISVGAVPISADTEGVLPAQGKTYAPSQTVKWKRAGPHVLKIRRMARESGRRYQQRVGPSKGLRPVVWAKR